MTGLRWWQKAVFYQIYPRSFADGNGDGTGDLLGIINRLDYLKDLGIDAIWLSPHYPSPMYDCGYDIADYTAVAPEYGSLTDFSHFIETADRKGIKVVLDLVLNHTSHQHAWFQESRASLSSAKRDWYIWRDGKNGGPPNNWASTFGGSAWELDPQTGQYYYHFFLKEQPDLNWRNPDVREAMFSAVRFWLDLGVAGFRLDAIGALFEDPGLPDHPVETSLSELYTAILQAANGEEWSRLNEQWRELVQHQVDQPGIHALLKDLRAEVDRYGGCVLIGETDQVAFHGSGEDELHMVFNFPLMRQTSLTPALIRQNQEDRLQALAAVSPKAWPSNTLGNHDSPRLYSHFGDGVHNEEIARLAVALMLTLKGTPFLYNGEEIGMTDLILDDLSQFRDLLGVWYYEAQVNELGRSPDEALRLAANYTRDKCRTPMQWEAAENAGFSPPGVQPWLPVNPNWRKGVSVAGQEADPASLLNFYKTLLALRKRTPCLIEGEYIPLHPHAADYLAFLRRTPAQACLVILNFSESVQQLSFPEVQPGRASALFSSRSLLTDPLNLVDFAIAPFEILILEVAVP